MMRHIGAVVAMVAALLAATGCAPSVRITRVGERDQPVDYDSTTFQFARDHHVQILFYRTTPAPFGNPDPDFEYVFFEVPDEGRFGWIRQDNIPIYRWVRRAGRDKLWQGIVGEDRIRFGLASDKTHLHFEFHVTMSPLGDTEGPAYVYSGNVRCTEDMVRTQGLINRYRDWLERLLRRAATEGAETTP